MAKIDKDTIGTILGAGGLGSMLLGAIGLHYYSHKLGPPGQKRIEKEVERAKKKGVDVGLNYVPGFTSNAFYLSPGTAWAIKKAPTPQTVSGVQITEVRPGGAVAVGDLALPVVLHELGHAHNEMERGYLRGEVNQALLAFAHGMAAALPLAAHNRTFKALAAAAMVPVLVEEARASRKALKEIQERKFSEKTKKNARRLLGSAYMTYLGLATAITGLALHK